MDVETGEGGIGGYGTVVCFYPLFDRQGEVC